jgi:hypothetical protein
MVISEKNKLLINRVLDTIDWDLIHKFYKLVGRSVGTETTQIPGVKKLTKGIKLDKSHIRDEINSVVNHIVENDMSQFIYGPWNIVWVNGEWEMEMPEIDENGNEIPGGQTNFIPIIESILEVHFSPMVVISKEIVVDEDEVLVESSETVELNKQLEKALADENYELASKIRDLIEMYKKKK